MKDIELANELEQLAQAITKAIVRLRYDHPKLENPSEGTVRVGPLDAEIGTLAEAVNTLKHIADDHKCCKVAIDSIIKLLIEVDCPPEQEPMVLPGFEEWWGGLPIYPSVRKTEYKIVDDCALSQDACKAVYNSLKSTVRPITDQEVMERWNMLKFGRQIQRLIPSFKTGGEWDIVPSVEIYRLKPQEPKKEKPKIKPKPEVVCLCGSTRFVDQFNHWRKQLTYQGKIVLSIEIVTTQVASEDPQHVDPEMKEMLDWLHLRKIDMADYVMVLDVGGYIGESTKKEINYAESKGKRIEFLSRMSEPKEPEKEPWEVAWEENEPFSMPNDNNRVWQWKQMFKLGYQAKEAATKGNQ